MRPLLLICLTLAHLVLTVQRTPHLVERVEEWAWCVEGKPGAQRARLVKRDHMRVDGKRGPELSADTITSIVEPSARFYGGSGH